MNTSLFIQDLPEERQAPMGLLAKTISENLPDGFTERLSDMIDYVVPFGLYPAGYHCPPRQPLPFISIASRKNFIALYHFGLYADPELLNWFTSEYPKHCKYKLDMGKSCIRFKRMHDIPVQLIGELVTRMTPQQWIAIYEQNVKR